MIKKVKIGETVFVEQTTYYIYRNDEDQKNDIAFLRTSDEKLFNRYLDAKKNKKWDLISKKEADKKFGNK